MDQIKFKAGDSCNSSMIDEKNTFSPASES